MSDARPRSNRLHPAPATVLAGALALSTPAWAHPGDHAPGTDTLWHVLTQPDHVAGIVLLLVIVGLIARYRSSSRTSRDRATGMRRAPIRR